MSRQRPRRFCSDSSRSLRPSVSQTIQRHFNCIPPLMKRTFPFREGTSLSGSKSSRASMFFMFFASAGGSVCG